MLQKEQSEYWKVLSVAGTQREGKVCGGRDLWRVLQPCWMVWLLCRGKWLEGFKADNVPSDAVNNCFLVVREWGEAQVVAIETNVPSKGLLCPGKKANRNLGRSWVWRQTRVSGLYSLVCTVNHEDKKVEESQWWSSSVLDYWDRNIVQGKETVFWGRGWNEDERNPNPGKTSIIPLSKSWVLKQFDFSVYDFEIWVPFEFLRSKQETIMKEISLSHNTCAHACTQAKHTRMCACGEWEYGYQYVLDKATAGSFSLGFSTRKDDSLEPV